MIGTGIGSAILIEGTPAAGRSHSELEHFRVRQHPCQHLRRDLPVSWLLSRRSGVGPAIAARAGTPASNLGADHPVWTAVADALGELAALLILTTAPHRILFGGGVGTSRAFPLQEIRSRTVQKLCGYVAGFDGASIDLRIAQASLGDLAGPLGSRPGDQSHR